MRPDEVDVTVYYRSQEEEWADLLGAPTSGAGTSADACFATF